MMTRLLFTLFAIFGISSLGYSTIHIYGNTNWSNFGVTQDVIIHSTGVLTVQNGLQMSAGNSITIEDGGQFVGIGGYITGAGQQWEGFIVEPTSTGSPSSVTAIYLYDFDVRDAKTAIFAGASGNENPLGTHNRKLYLANSIFEDNGSHLTIANKVTNPSNPNLSISELDLMTQSGVNIQGCTFGLATDVWPIHILYTNDVSFSNCTFTGNIVADGSRTSLHVRYFYNGHVSNCTFDESRNYYISMHGYSKNSKILNNDFNLLYLGSSYNRYGIEVGSLMGGYFHDAIFEGNDFYNYNGQKHGTGISMEGHIAAGYEDISIDNNTFYGLERGVVLRSGVGNQNLITDNSVDFCNKGLMFINGINGGNNDGVFIECNDFSNTSTDIWIDYDASLEDQDNGYDPANTFSVVSGKSKNIRNYGPTIFTYQYWTNFPVVFLNGKIVLQYVTSLADCSSGGNPNGKSATVSVQASEDQINQFPNPATREIFFELNNQEIDAVQLLTLDGKVLEEISGNSLDAGRINVENIESGIYLTVYSVNRIPVKTVKVVIN